MSYNTGSSFSTGSSSSVRPTSRNIVINNVY
jgi:hypothetical protein